MNKFLLDERLAADCIRVADWNESILLLMNNSLVPWFILVPKTEVLELCHLPASLRHQVGSNIDLLSCFILAEFNVSKLNVAAIGNVVNQLHIHVVGRYPGDYCWPDVVWGRPEREPYTDSEAQRVCNLTRVTLDIKLS